MSDLERENTMLANNKDYPIAEMEKLLKTKGKQNIDRKLQRYGIDFPSVGRGTALVYTIKHIPDPFKVYAIVKYFCLGNSEPRYYQTEQ